MNFARRHVVERGDRRRGEGGPRRVSKQRCGVGGFTLVEMVISAALMSIVLVSGYLCLSAGFAGQRLVEVRADVAQNARVALALLSADLRGACPLSAEFDFLGMDRRVGAVEADNLDFATHHYSPRRPGEGDFCEVSYFLDQNPKTGVFSLFRRRDASPDGEPLAGGSREEIATGVRGFQAEFYDGYEWFQEWGDAEGRQRKRQEDALATASNLSGLPEAVRITLVFSAEEKRTSDEPASGEAVEESELSFQTIVRLNLAGATWSGSATGADSNAGTSGGQSPGSSGSRGGGRN